MGHVDCASADCGTRVTNAARASANLTMIARLGSLSAVLRLLPATRSESC
jgi:hypothetical protein